jgi:hypothetical protein
MAPQWSPDEAASLNVVIVNALRNEAGRDFSVKGAGWRVTAFTMHTPTPHQEDRDIFFVRHSARSNVFFDELHQRQAGTKLPS